MALHQGRDTIRGGLEVGDLVWGKVEPHPWWPGYIYHEKFSCHPSVMKTKVTGHVLVVFFQDRKFGWFLPSELIPFEENYEKMARQSSSKNFVKAVEEAKYELCRMRRLGLACRCRNKSNFGPSKVEQYLEVDVGDGQSWPHSLSQISKARDSFQPSSMLFFVQHLALTPMNAQHRTLDFIKNEATVLAWRKAQYDGTYVRSFEAHLSEGLEKAEALGMGELPVQPTKTNDQLDRNGRSNERKTKKDRVHKCPGGELSFERTSLAENKKKKLNKVINRESSAELVQLPVAASLCAGREKFSANPVQVPLVDEIPAGQNNVVIEYLSSPEEFRQLVETGKNRLRSSVYKKSMLLLPPSENQANGAWKQLAVSATSVKRTGEQSSLNPVRPLSRPHDPVKGGRKRGPLEHIEQIRKKVNGEDVKNEKRHLDLEESGKKKLKTNVMDLGDTKKINATDMKILAGETKMLPGGESAPETRYIVEQSSIVMNPTKLNFSLDGGERRNDKFPVAGSFSATNAGSKNLRSVAISQPNVSYASSLQIQSFPVNVPEPKPDRVRKQSVSIGSLQRQVQLKSCLNKAARDGHNGDEQLIFSLVRGESRRNDQFPVAGSSSATNAGSKNLQPFAVSRPNVAYTPCLQFQSFLVNVPEPIPDRVPRESVPFGSLQLQVKRCLKKPAIEGHNGDGRWPSRLKFSLDGQERRRDDQFHVAGSSSATNAGSKNLQTFAISQPNVAYSPSLQHQRFPVNVPFNQQHGLINPPTIPHFIAPQKSTNVDISQRMIQLLEICTFVVENLKEALKNKAYRPL